MREIKFRYIFEDIKEDGRTLVTQIWNLNDIEINDIVYDTEVLIARNQYTGRKDKNGVEIYEGDILYHHLQGNRVVEYGSQFKNYGGYMLASKGGMRGTLNDTDSLYEVVGNIYEHAHLLDNN